MLRLLNETTRVKDKFTKTYNEYADSIFRYCVLRVSDRDVAMDLTQQAFMRYWDSLVRGTAIANDKAFLFTIARNAITDWYRKKKPVSLEGLQEKSEDGEEFVIIDDNAKGALELDTEGRFLLGKIHSLPHTSQQVLYLRYIEDLKPKEIAEILNIGENAVSVRIHRALDDLRKITGYEEKNKHNER